MLLRNAIQHALKGVGWPDADSVPHWMQACAALPADARDRIEPGMAQYLDFRAIHADALASVQGLEMPGQARELPEGAVVGLAELKDARFGAAALVARLREG
ncbi:MAG: hypothetical protein B7Z52_04835 [Burkholderiales bacterium 12-64-5]|nr:MAG: hypothetical protein B7Z52_04835 [Burkholderiales bacterium 12-64-5]